MAQDLTYPDGRVKAKFLKALGSECACKYPSSEGYLVENDNVYEKVDAFR